MREENPLPQQPAAGAAAAQQQAGAAAAEDDPAKKELEERRKAAEEGLPEGWAVAFDGNKKPYYWHKQVGAGGSACLLPCCPVHMRMQGRGCAVAHPPAAAIHPWTADQEDCVGQADSRHAHQLGRPRCCEHDCALTPLVN